ncbi:hypothetical protein ACF0H5_007269 [Mactra antiquata]
MELNQYINVISLILIGTNGVWSISVEPEFTKFKYEEQLLEKMIRLEIYVGNMENTIQKFINDYSIIVNETKKAMEKEISIGNNNMELMKSEMKEFYKNVTSTMAQEQTSLRRQPVTPLIAFNACGKTDGTYASGTPVVFQEVLLNEGKCYSNDTGYFTASVDGIYQFNAQICVLKGDEIDYTINVESVSVLRGETRMATDSSDEKCASFSVTTLVRKAQKVYVTAYGMKLDPNADDWNSFSGTIIRQL